MKTPDISKTKQQYVEFINKMKTIIISTLDDDGRPFTSYAPFVKHDGKLYIYISKIANHYRYIDERPQIDVMFIEDETHTANLFARQRARFACHATNLGNEAHEEIFRLFDEAFSPNLMKMLRGLDFSLFELTVLDGRYVVGFGQAFETDLDGNDIVHVTVDKEEKEEGDKPNG